MPLIEELIEGLKSNISSLQSWNKLWAVNKVA